MPRRLVPLTACLLIVGVAAVWLASSKANTNVAAKKKTHTITCQFYARPTTVGGGEGKAPKSIK